MAALVSLAAAHHAQPRFVISGRVEDPHNLRQAGLMLSVGFDRDGVGYGIPVTMTASGAFATNWLLPGHYALTVIRDPYSPTAPSTPVGLTITRIVDADVTGVVVTIRPDMTLEGRIRMPHGARLPAGIAVTSCLEPEDLRVVGCLAADVRPDGRFVLRNAFGPRLLTVASAAEPGVRYAEPRVFLNGVDVTHAAVDFSAYPDARLEVVFSRAGPPVF